MQFFGHADPSHWMGSFARETSALSTKTPASLAAKSTPRTLNFSAKAVRTMDRPSFLSSLPFLAPLPSSTWPVSSQVKLEGHQLSLEPKSAKNASPIGVAFFDSEDPATIECDLSFTLEQQRLVSTARLLLRVDGRVYAVDWRHVDCRSRAPTPLHPACLLLTAPWLVMRLFSTDIDAAEDYQKVQDAMEHARDMGASVGGVAAMDSPSGKGSSSASATDGAQYSPQQQRHDSPRPIKRCRYQAVKEGLERLDDVLQLPATTAAKQPNLVTDVLAMMTNLGEDLAAAYENPTTTTMEQEDEDHTRQLEAALSDFFPAPRSKPKADIDRDDTLVKVQDWLERHRQSMAEKHERLLWPVRSFTNTTST